MNIKYKKIMKNPILFPPKIACKIAISEGSTPVNANNACKILNINHTIDPLPDMPFNIPKKYSLLIIV